jgi:4-deoxy-L-threo-5-hexosulose-uronate ketol-isomerase
MADPIRYTRMTTEELRSTFLLCDLFQPGKLDLVYVDLDRTIIGSAVPVNSPLTLTCPELLKAAYFTERRELGCLNIGGSGQITVGDETFVLNHLDVLYVGRGNQNIQFESLESEKPAEFYLLSYPAHAVHPTRLIRSVDLPHTTLGSPETANLRDIKRAIHLKGIRSCQLVMGFTQLATGSVWNTMPPHTHNRRSEVYLYFDLPETERVVHLMGPAHETRNLVIANRQVVISPGWSIHAGVGTTNYSFCWGMGGENQEYDDMDRLTVADLM